MKKLISILLASVLMIAMLCGCGSNTDIDTAALTIEDHEWTFTVMQGSNGEIITCSAAKQELYENAIVSEFIATVADDTLTISDAATGESLTVTYTVETENTDSTVYAISNATIGVFGMATVDITEYDDGSSEYTLTLSSDGYSIYFVDTIE